jgi:two-component system LytT family response regulator
MTLSVLVADDEPLARRGVTLRLQSHEEFEVIGECSNGGETVEFIKRHNPDLVFLDIQMPVMTGIDVARSLPEHIQPFIIFLTAFDEYLMQAFEVHAIDYLLKPVDEGRFAASLSHAYRVLGTREPSNYSRNLNSFLFKDKNAPTEGLRDFAIRIGRQLHLLPVENVDWIEAYGDYVKIHVGASAHLIRESLNSVEERLTPGAFLRIHRSAIVRLNRIATLSSLPNRDCSVTLVNGTSLRVSRTYSDHLRRLLRKRPGSRTSHFG